MSLYEIAMWVGAVFVFVGYGWTSRNAFAESTLWGWWVTIFVPLNLIFAYIYAGRSDSAENRSKEVGPLLCYGAGISLWALTYVVSWVSPTASVAPWHGFELAA